MKKQRTIHSEHFSMNHEEHFLIVVEVVDDVIVATYPVKVPRQFLTRHHIRKGCQMFPN